jgi:hypothetical protein
MNQARLPKLKIMKNNTMGNIHNPTDGYLKRAASTPTAK